MFWKDARFHWLDALLRIRQRNVLRAGFGVVIALSLVSAMEVYRAQRTLSARAAEICRLHVQQDDALFRLRRTLWLGAIAGRDYLLDPHPERAATFNAQLAKLRSHSDRLLDELALAGAPAPSVRALRTRVDEFWKGIEPIPAAARNLSLAEGYDFVQRDLVPRRNAVGEALWDFTWDSQKVLEENEDQFARARRDADGRLFVTLGISLILGVLVAGFSLLRSGTLERKAALQFEEVTAAKADLQRLSARLIEIQEQERTRLSRELHDRVGQTLATLRLEIARAESVPFRHLPEIRQRLNEARGLAESAIQSIRNMSLLLRPSLLDDLGLGPALQWLTEHFRRRTGIACEFSEQGAAGDLPDAVRTCVYRVVQEALHNCEKHSAALLVRVSVAQTADALEVVIEDNGNGFEPERAVKAAPPGLGIIGMRERAATLGGQLTVESGVGRGTRVELRLPYSGAGAARTVPSEVSV
jgi:signal transduction histidine kinase